LLLLSSSALPLLSVPFYLSFRSEAEESAVAVAVAVPCYSGVPARFAASWLRHPGPAHPAATSRDEALAEQTNDTTVI
jgi:hypothetical protein